MTDPQPGLHQGQQGQNSYLGVEHSTVASLDHKENPPQAELTLAMAVPPTSKEKFALLQPHTWLELDLGSGSRPSFLSGPQ